MCSVDNVVASVFLLGEGHVFDHNVVASMSLLRERKIEYMKVGSSMLLFIIVGASSLPDVQFVVSTKAASGYNREIPCPTDGDPWQPLPRGINIRETTCV